MLGGEIGRHVTIARRKGHQWFVGGLTDWDARSIVLDLSQFLDGTKDYSAVLLRDGPNADRFPQNYRAETFRVSGSKQLNVEMRKGGGFAMRLSPIDGERNEPATADVRP